MKLKEIEIRLGHDLSKVVVSHRHAPGPFEIIIASLNMLLLQVTLEKEIALGESAFGLSADQIGFAIRLNSPSRTADDDHLGRDSLSCRQVLIDDKTLCQVIAVHHLTLSHFPFRRRAESGLDLTDALDHLRHFGRQQTYFVVVALHCFVYGKMFLDDSGSAC